MAQTDHKHQTMSLYTQPGNMITHWIMLVFAEKTIKPNIVWVDPKNIPATLAQINPYGIYPFLTDQQGLMLYTPCVMIEYLEERFPHPPLLPVYPKIRAQCRQVIYQIEHEWYGLLQRIESKQNNQEAVQLLQRGLSKFAPLFEVNSYFLSEEITLVDCCILPILWRLKELNINIADEITTISAYQKRLFARQPFQDSLDQFKTTTSNTHVDL